MRNTATFLLLILLAVSALVTAGCGNRVAASIQSVSEPVVPRSLAWAAVPGPGLSAEDPATLLLVEQTAASLAGVLAMHDWKWLSNPADAASADILVRIRWGTGRPQYIREFVPGPYYGMGWGYRRYGPFFGGYFEPRIQTIYTRTLIVEALRADALSPAVKAAVLHQSMADMKAAPTVPVLESAAAKSQQDPSKPPYAPPLSLDGFLPSETGAGQKKGPYAPPILDSDQAGIPQEAVVWRVEVSSGGSRPDTQKILPQLAAAAAQAVGKTMQTDVFVDSNMGVTYKVQ